MTIGIGLALGIISYNIAKFLGPLFPLLLLTIWWLPKRGQFPVKTAAIITIIFLALTLLYGWGGLWRLNLIVGAGFVLIPSNLSNKVLRGTTLVTTKQLQRELAKKEAKLLKQQGQQPTTPKLEIGGIVLPNYLENLSFGFFGSPGSGKSQSILQILHILRQRDDWRVMVLDRNGELMEKLWCEGDLIFHPKDARSIGWSHGSEGAQFSTIAAGLIPDDPKERFFSDAAKNLIADVYERTYSNTEVWDVLTRFSLEQLKDFLAGTVSMRYFEGESGNTAGSVLATAVNQVRFYQSLAKCPAPAEFSFSRWGRDDNSCWIFLPLFEDDAETFKPLITTCFELMLRGLLSNENRKRKTALVIDELGALSQLKSLPRLLSESRKFGGSAFIGTQTTAQIEEIYGERGARIILQGLATKLILNIRDQATAEQFSKMIGVQERIDITRSKTYNQDNGSSSSQNQQIRETAAVLPSELQNLPPLEGYLVIADGSSPARVRVTPKSYPSNTQRFVPIDTIV
ncbi:MAG: type IV secretion system DNA-binding domain-containing protein [Scytonema hyalinum WJT4-NPBG1]|nr:type IV secretion system DNA-binding domain-containing protein [Scytonema hyalinum WJT4-NPBG1]